MESTPQLVRQDSFEAARRAIEQRRIILGPCLAAMGFTEQGGCPPELPQQFQFDGQAVQLESWEHDVLLGRASSNSETLLAHLAEGIAFQARCLSTLRQFELDPLQANDLRKLGSVIEEAAVGLALQEELQRDIDDLVGKGEMADAKRLTGFRGRIVLGVLSLKRSLGGPAQEQAQSRSAEMLTPRIVEPTSRKKAMPNVSLDLPASAPVVEIPEPEPEPEPEPGLELEEPQVTAEELFVLGLREQQGKLPHEVHVAGVVRSRGPDPARRFRLLLYALVACGVAYGFFLAIRPASVPVPDRLGIERFEHLGGVVQVRPRPPSLYVKLNTKSWAEMSPEGRLELVESLGRIAGEEGYFGVLVRTRDGQTVGHWLKKTGAALIVRAPSS